MTNPVNEPDNQAQLDTRANLFYFLQSLAVHKDEKDRQRGANSSVSDEHSQRHTQSDHPAS